MSDPGAPTVVDPIQSGLEPTPFIVYSLVDSILSWIQPTSWIQPLPASTAISDSSTGANPTPTSLSPIPSTSDFLTPTAIPSSIPAISLSSISTDDPITTATSTSIGDQTVTVVETQTAVLSTDTPRNTSFADQTGAIIGVTLAATFLLLLIILLIFFACRHHSNRSNNSSMENILPVSRNASWRSPLEEDDDENYSTPYERSMFPDYPEPLGSQGHGEGRFFSPSMSHSYSFNDGRDTSRPWWANTKPLNINKRSNSQRLPLTVDSVVGSRNTSLSGGSSSKRHRGPGSSEAPLSRSSTRKTFITKPRPIHRLNGRRHYSTPPNIFALGRGYSLEYDTQRIQRHQEEETQQNPIYSSVSQARLRRQKAYSQSTIRSEESASPSDIHPFSPLHPPIYMSQTVPRLYLPHGVTGSGSNNTLSQHRGGDTSKGLPWPSVTIPSPASSTNTRSMVEGLLHPRLGMALAQSQSQRASATSLRDHEDYTRPINGRVNNYLHSTTTFEVLDTVALGE